MTFLSSIQSFNTSSRQSYVCKDTNSIFSIKSKRDHTRLSIYQICELAKSKLSKDSQGLDISKQTPAQKSTLRSLFACNNTLLTKLYSKHCGSTLFSLIYKVSELFYNFICHGRFATHTQLLLETKELLQNQIDFDIESADLNLSDWNKDVVASVFNARQFSKIEEILFNPKIDSFTFRAPNTQDINSFLIEKRISPSHDHANYASTSKNTYSLSFRILYHHNGTNHVLPIEFKIREQHNLVEQDYKHYNDARSCLSNLKNIHFQSSGILRFKTLSGTRSVFVVVSSFGSSKNLKQKVTKETVESLTTSVCSSLIDVAVMRNNIGVNLDTISNQVKFVFNEVSVMPEDPKTGKTRIFNPGTILTPTTGSIDSLKNLISTFPQYKETIISTTKKHPNYYKRLVEEIG